MYPQYTAWTLLLLYHLLPLNTGLTWKRNNIWKEINAVSSHPDTELSGFVVTPLPWPHSWLHSKPDGTAGSTTSPPEKNMTSTTSRLQRNVTTTVAPPMKLNQSSSWTIVSVGCYRDSYVKPRPLPELIADFRESIDRQDVNKTVMACAQEARRRGFKFFGIQYYSECWSGTGADKTYGRDGTSKDCENGVGKSGASFVYRFGDYELSPCPVCEQPRRLCFPAVSRVTLESGESISMRQLNIGDRVSTLGTNGVTMYSEVIAFLHKEVKTTAKFYNLKTNGEDIVRLSSQHLIFRKKNITSPISAVFASEINIGDLLYVLNENVSTFQAVTKITMTTEIGVYAPLTRQGTLLVDGTLVSCYAHWPSHCAAHFVMAPLRAAYTLYRAWERVTGIQRYSPQQTEGTHWYAGALMPLSSIFFATVDFNKN